MARFCALCHLSFSSSRGFAHHRRIVHRNPKPRPPPTVRHEHVGLSAGKCDRNGVFLGNQNVPPPPYNGPNGYFPWEDRIAFEFTKLTYKEMQESAGNLEEILRLWHAKCILEGCPEAAPPFDSVDDLLDTIDQAPYGDTGWRVFRVRYTGPIEPNSPSWMRKTYLFYAHNTLAVAEQLAQCPEFNGKFDYRPYTEYTQDGTRRFCDLMSGQWAWKKATTIAHNVPGSLGSMLVPIVLGADKTTVSVATGNQEFHPVYMSLGNIHNDMRRAHRDSVVPIAFLAIPKGDHHNGDEEEFRIFKKNLYHTSLAKVLEPLRPGMTTPHPMRCPDGHYRRAIFELGPFIADYPEQVYLSCVVYGWCPK
ncbi:uncharacterized protein BXZ73DRAFT_107744 [Epithele typhae]|uniref:uncharacterized protein n=1 Tax=Epithele typhae TaxID=378194 RepID=UPI002007B2AF|nr:uncharacterized protein BXZ73DRAFT_107744 [Epithele typhae]KAH9911914.1 hypothetical protein BXZ73DRAFT_107744 [Epithele typhae]